MKQIKFSAWTKKIELPAHVDLRYHMGQEAFSAPIVEQPRFISCRPLDYSIPIAQRTRKKEEKITRRPAVRQCGDLP